MMVTKQQFVLAAMMSVIGCYAMDTASSGSNVTLPMDSGFVKESLCPDNQTEGSRDDGQNQEVKTEQVMTQSEFIARVAAVNKTTLKTHDGMDLFVGWKIGDQTPKAGFVDLGDSCPIQ